MRRDWPSDLLVVGLPAPLWVAQNAPGGADHPLSEFTRLRLCHDNGSSSHMTLPALTPYLAYAIACVFGAAIVRGFSGFGFSLLVITALSLVLPPVEVIASVLIMEIAASLHLMPGIWRDIHWRSLSFLTLGQILATPFGVWALAHVPVGPMKLALSGLVLATVALLWMGFALKRMPGDGATTATGAASGLLNGAFGIGGPPVVLFFLSSPAGVAAGRASLIAYFFGTDVIALGWQAWAGLVTADHLVKAVLFLPALIAGIWLGARGFRGVDPALFRKAVLALLAAMALLIGAQGLGAF
jgi:uncharacterized protein